MRMHKIEADRIYTLDAFIEAHEEHRQVWMHVEVCGGGQDGTRSSGWVAWMPPTVKTELISCCPCKHEPR